MRIAFFALALAVPTIAWGQQSRSVEYFIMHNADRQQMHSVCAMQAVYSVECMNSQKADHYILAAEAKQQASRDYTNAGSINSPAYWTNFPLARKLTLQDCANPSNVPPMFRPSQQSCQAARISVGQ